MSININVPKEVEIALNNLVRNGFEAYIVGGCLRDILLGVVPNDWDITTSAKPNDISMCFNNYKTINTGLKHGTVTVIINGMQLEVTTYRIDGKYSDNRRPDSVLFTDNVAHDLKRRDFTINAMAYNKDGIVDLFGGINDIEKRSIRCVGEPDERFNEDGLRILRALRFASVLNFNIDDKTSTSIHKNKNLLTNISKERICTEFNKLLKGKNYYNIMIEYRDVIEVFIPGIKSYSEQTWEGILNSLNYVDSLSLKLSLLLIEINNLENILKDLKYDGTTIKEVNIIDLNKNLGLQPDKIQIKKQLRKINYNNYINLIKFKKAIYKTEILKYEQELLNIKAVESILNNIIMNNECYSLKSLEINGDDLIQEGFSKGVLLGKTLNNVLELVIEEKLENKKEVLIEYVKKFKK